MLHRSVFIEMSGSVICGISFCNSFLQVLHPLRRMQLFLLHTEGSELRRLYPPRHLRLHLRLLLHHPLRRLHPRHFRCARILHSQSTLQADTDRDEMIDLINEEQHPRQDDHDEKARAAREEIHPLSIKNERGSACR